MTFGPVRPARAVAVVHTGPTREAAMGTITLYTFESADGIQYGSWSTFEREDAEIYGQKHSVRVIANDYEWADSEVHRDFARYSFEQLSEEAQAKAVETVRERNASREWDGDDVNDMRDTLTWALAGQLKSPGWDKYGAGDFPGIDGITVVSFSIDHRPFIGAEGSSLTRTNAPALPWVDAIDQVDLSAPHNVDGTVIEVLDANRECDCYQYPHKDLCESFRPDVTDAERNAMEDAVRGALNAALAVGQKETEYQASEEKAREDAKDLDYVFDADGSILD